MRRKVTHQHLEGPTGCVKPALLAVIPFLPLEGMRGNPQMWRHSLGLPKVPGGRVWPWQGKGPTPAFSLPASNGFIRFVQHPTSSVERQWEHCESPQPTRMGLAGRARSFSSSCCSRRLLMWICKFPVHSRADALGPAVHL